MADDPKWSTMSPHQLLDEAQDKYAHSYPEEAALLVAAAQVQAVNMLDWTIGERLIPRLER